jgi:hypothetical protein
MREGRRVIEIRDKKIKLRACSWVGCPQEGERSEIKREEKMEIFDGLMK